MLTARKLADVSTSHITRDDCMVLEANSDVDQDPSAFPLRVSKYEYGFFILIPSLADTEKNGTTLDDLRKDLLEAGMSEAFVTLIQQAMKERFFALNIDSSGEEVKELEKFDW